MSWDIMVYGFRGAPPPVDEWDDDSAREALGSSAEVRSKIDASLPGVDWSDPEWGVFEGNEFSFEFNLDDEESIDSFMIHVRGGGDAVATLLKVAVPNGWSLYDLSTDEWIDPKDPSNAGWEDFQAFRDRALGDTRNEADSE